MKEAAVFNQTINLLLRSPTIIILIRSLLDVDNTVNYMQNVGLLYEILMTVSMCAENCLSYARKHGKCYVIRRLLGNWCQLLELELWELEV